MKVPEQAVAKLAKALLEANQAYVELIEKMEASEQYISLAEAEEMSSLSKRQLRWLGDTNRIRTKRISERVRLYLLSDVMANTSQGAKSNQQ